MTFSPHCLHRLANLDKQVSDSERRPVPQAGPRLRERSNRDLIVWLVSYGPGGDVQCPLNSRKRQTISTSDCIPNNRRPESILSNQTNCSDCILSNQTAPTAFRKRTNCSIYRQTGRNKRRHNDKPDNRPRSEAETDKNGQKPDSPAGGVGSVGDLTSGQPGWKNCVAAPRLVARTNQPRQV